MPMKFYIGTSKNCAMRISPCGYADGSEVTLELLAQLQENCDVVSLAIIKTYNSKALSENWA